MLRPDVVLFGEGLPEWELRRATRAVEQCDHGGEEPYGWDASHIHSRLTA